MYYIAICDDSIEFIHYMKKMLLQSGMHNEEMTIYEYQSGEEMINDIGNREKIDLLILDMQMKELDGHETAKLFRRQFPSSVMVFCSGVCLPTVESFETTPFRFLLKEYTDERMQHELEVIIQEIKHKAVEPMVIGTWKYSSIKLSLDEILYISISRNGSNIYANPQIIKHEFENRITSKKKLSEFYVILNEYGFEYAHNSYLINLNHIKRITTKELELSDGTILSIARSKEKNLRVAFAKHKALKY